MNRKHLLSIASALLAFCQTSPMHAAQRVEYLHSDALGSAVVVTNQAGQIISRTDYSAYGEVLAGSTPPGLGYAGHTADPHSGLTYMQQRYYDPHLGVFLSVDPVAAYRHPVQMFNRYRYANNNPYAFIDPDGQCPEGASRSTCIEASGFDAARSGGQNVQASQTTEAAMKSGAGQVAVGSGSKEKLGFTVPAEGGGEKVVLGKDVQTGSNPAGYTATATPPDGATAAIHGHVENSGLVDIAGLGDASPLLTHSLPNAAVTSDGRRIGVTELVDGKVQFRMIKGRMTTTEIRLKQKNVTTQQQFFYKKD